MGWRRERDGMLVGTYSVWWDGRQTGVRDNKVGERLDGSGDGIRVGARRDRNRFGMGAGW